MEKILTHLISLSCIAKQIREMLTGAPRALVKKINIEILHREMMKSGTFHVIKVKKLLFLMENFYF